MATTANPPHDLVDSHELTNGKKKQRRRNRKQRDKKSGTKPARPVDNWDRWTAHLLERKSPVSMDHVFANAGQPPLLWAAPDGVDQQTAELVQRLHRTAISGSGAAKLAGKAEAWLAKAFETPPAEADDAGRCAETSRALESLAWCYALPRLAPEMDEPLWWRLLDTLVVASRDAAGIDLSGKPLVHQLLAGELALALATLFPEVDQCRDLRSAAVESLGCGLKELLDTGMPEAHNLPLQRPLAACWTRCALLADSNRAACFGKKARGQYADAVEQLLRLSRSDGTQPLVTGASGRWCKPLFETAIRLSGVRDHAAIAALAVGLGKPPGKKRRLFLPRPSDNSEWAESVLLRSSWDRRRESLAVTYHDRAVATELNVGRQTVWSGTFDADIRIDGRPLSPADDWEEVCWSADDDVDYLELEMKFEGGWKLQRQLVLPRDDRVLLLADALIGPDAKSRPQAVSGSDAPRGADAANGSASSSGASSVPPRSEIEYHLALPLSAGVRLVPAEESNEACLETDDRLGLVLPLALPEWRAERGPGRLFSEDGHLVLSLQTAGRALYAPLFIDLKPSRVMQPFTWRRLTVAEDLQIQPADAAVGYRVQCGRRQWLIYRTLAAAAPRTVLGQHLGTDFYFGRFTQDGEVEDLIEVESD